MAIGAGVDADFLQSRTGLKRRTTSHTSDHDTIVLWVDVFFHTFLLPPWTVVVPKKVAL